MRNEINARFERMEANMASATGIQEAGALRRGALSGGLRIWKAANNRIHSVPNHENSQKYDTRTPARASMILRSAVLFW